MSREVIWPPSLRITHIERRLIGNAGVSRSPLSGATTTVDRSGDRWRIAVTVENLSDRASYAERASAETFLAAIRNRNARVWIEDPGYVQRGSFSAPELFTNADFASGTTGWVGAGAALSVSDRVMRVTRSVGSAESDLIQAITGFTQYAPHALRSFILDGKGSTGLNIGRAMAAGVGAGTEISDYSTARGLGTVSLVARGTTSENQFPAVIASNSLAGDYISVPWCSLSRCALVDNGPNALLYSDQIDNAAWTKSAATVTANAATAPDGTSTADALVEDSANDAHYVWQSTARASAAEDYCAYGYFKRGSGTRNVRLDVMPDGGSNFAACIFDLGAGTAGGVSLTGSVTNGRASIRDAGNGWYFCAVVARLPATTALWTEALLVNSNNVSYTGDGTSSVYAWRLGAARSGLPTRGALTTGTALASGTNQTGSGLYLKGLPVSTSGLLLAGDSVQIGKQWFKVLAPLDSDAAGLGYLEVSPNIRTPFADNEPVIINRPMGRYMLANEEAGYSTRAGRFSTLTLEFEEALD